MTQTCKECSYFEDCFDYESAPISVRVTGKCHRHPPSVVAKDDERRVGPDYFTVVRKSDWCGDFAAATKVTLEHKLTEENIRLRRENTRWYWMGALGWLVNILWLIHFFC